MASKRLGLILLGHGSRDPQWSEPFERLRRRVRQRSVAVDVEVAYLEHAQPDVAGAVARLAGAGATSVTIVPVFVGQGGHVRRDVPALAQAARERFPAIDIRVAASIGDDESVIDALAEYCLRSANGGEAAR